MKDHDKIEKKDLEIAEKAIEESKSIKEKMLSREVDDSGEVGDVTGETSRVEQMVEIVHQVARMDKQQGAERLQTRLEQSAARRRRKAVRRWLYAGGSVAAAVLLLFGVMLFTPANEEEPQNLPVAHVKIPEIKVPTLITTREDNVVLSLDSLEIKDSGNVYVAKGSRVKAGEKREANVETERPIRYNQIVIPAGYTYKVQLADGSSVTLNAGSELRFPEEFRDSVREVELKGEAYFDVKKSGKPFIVKAGKTRVKVYGTKFNMFYCEKLALSEAVLLEGSIGMTVGREEIKITPNQRVYCSVKDSLIRTEKVDPIDYVSWLGHSFRYNKVRLDKIVYDISQWYGVDIKLAPELEKEIFSLEFDKSSTIDWMVRALGLIINKPVKQEGGVYYIE